MAAAAHKENEPETPPWRAAVYDSFDFKNPDYAAIFAHRAQALAWIRAKSERLAPIKAYYRTHEIAFINDWGMTYDPRNVDRGLPAHIPFVLFPRQVDWLECALEYWRARRPFLTEKSRDCGVSWLAMSLACTLGIFNEGFSAGFGSRKEEYVDLKDSPKALFTKGRMFMAGIPREFRAGYVERTCAPFKRIILPETRSVITGEAGDSIGRGDRTSFYVVDESAHLEHPAQADAALASTTNCRVDISSVNGMANSFAQKRHGGKIHVFIFDWRDDPRKDDAWYAQQVEDLDNPVVVAQEIDRNYTASAEGLLIPSAWVQASLDAHVLFGATPTGRRSGSLDVADEGMDANAFCGAHGWVVEHIEHWSGAGSDPAETAARAFALCDQLGYEGFVYDADGIGASVRGDARLLNEIRLHAGIRQLRVHAFRGSAGVENPEGQDVKGRFNADYFQNLKAQKWWSLRSRFHRTFKAVEVFKADGTKPATFDDLISISLAAGPKGTKPQKLISELSQPTYSVNTVGKIVIDKAPEGAKSPNEADALMMEFSGASRGMILSSETVRRFKGMGKR